MRKANRCPGIKGLLVAAVIAGVGIVSTNVAAQTPFKPPSKNASQIGPVNVPPGVEEKEAGEIQQSVKGIADAAKVVSAKAKELNALLSDILSGKSSPTDSAKKLKSFDHVLVEMMDQVQVSLDETSLNGDSGRQLFGLIKALQEEKKEYDDKLKAVSTPEEQEILKMQISALAEDISKLENDVSGLKEIHMRLGQKLLDMHRVRPQIAFALRREKIREVHAQLQAIAKGMADMEALMGQAQSLVVNKSKVLAGAPGN